MHAGGPARPCSRLAASPPRLRPTAPHAALHPSLRSGTAQQPAHLSCPTHPWHSHLPCAPAPLPHRQRRRSARRQSAAQPAPLCWPWLLGPVLLGGGGVRERAENRLAPLTRRERRWRQQRVGGGSTGGGREAAGLRPGCWRLAATPVSWFGGADACKLAGSMLACPPSPLRSRACRSVTLVYDRCAVWNARLQAPPPLMHLAKGRRPCPSGGAPAGMRRGVAHPGWMLPAAPPDADSRVPDTPGKNRYTN